MEKTYSHWDIRFLELAKFFSSWSKDPSTKVGSVVVKDRQILATGYNGFPRGIADDDRLHNREEKYGIIRHGEENALLDAARRGVSLLGATAYIYPLPPCMKCTGMLLQVEIARVVVPAGDVPDRWKADLAKAKALLDEAGVPIDYVPLV